MPTILGAFPAGAARRSAGALPRGSLQLEGVQLIAEELITASSNAAAEGPAAYSTGHMHQILGPHDRAICPFGHYGLSVVLEQAVVPLLLKRALAAMLATFPWMAGRLHWDEAGQLDIDCCNRGALFCVASTATTLEQLMAATQPDPGTGAMADVQYPWLHKFMVGDINAMLDKQCPLLMGTVVQLSGGGSLMTLVAQHALCDFESLQLMAAHWSAHYNGLLQQWMQQAGLPDEGDAGAAPAGAVGNGNAGQQAHCGTLAAAADSELPNGKLVEAAEVHIRAVASMTDATADTSIATADATTTAADLLPPPIVCSDWARPYEDAGAAQRAGVPYGDLFVPFGIHLVPRLVLLNELYYTRWLGGGLQECVIHVPAARLAELKRQANQELAAALAAGRGPREGPQWVSTNDALWARVVQVLHSLPGRSDGPMTIAPLLNFRQRLSPPLPANHLHNVIQWITTELPAEAQHESLGLVAGRLRDIIDRTALPIFQTHLARVAAMLGRPKSAVIGSIIVHHHPRAAFFSPHGSLGLNQWRVDTGAYAFGRAPPLRVFKTTNLSPNMVNCLQQQPGGSVQVSVSLHACVWRAIEQRYGGLVI